MRGYKTVTLTAEQLDCAALVTRAALMKVQRDLEEQAAKLPAGDDSWAELAKGCAYLHATWLKLAKAARG
jgi:hypothetical protein